MLLYNFAIHVSNHIYWSTFIQGYTQVYTVIIS